MKNDIRTILTQPIKKLRYLYWVIKESVRFNLHKDNISPQKPVFIVGLQGGGLTLISRIIRRNPHTVSVGGNSNRWYAYDEMQNRRADLPESFKLHGSKPHGTYGFWDGAWLYGTDEYFDYFRKKREDFTNDLGENFREVLKRIIARHAKNMSNTRIVDKSQTFGLKIPLIRRMLEGHKPKFLIVTRNPYIACKKSTQKPALSWLSVSKEKKLKLATQHYANCVGAMLEDAAETDTHILRFEDFLADPESRIREVCDFTELEFDEDMMPAAHHSCGDRKWYPIRKDVNKDVLEGLGQKEAKIIEKKCWKIANKLSYSSS